jgi:hypothetical protein
MTWLARAQWQSGARSSTARELGSIR